MARHRETHPHPVDGCFGCKVLGLQVSPAAMPARTEGDRDYHFQRGFDRQNTEDRDAYRRLRRSGLQPRQIAGSAHVERHAETPYEVASGQIPRDRTQRRQLGEALTLAADSGFDPTVAAAGTPWTKD